MRFELKKLVRDAADAVSGAMADKARALGRRAQARAGRLWKDVGAMIRRYHAAAAAEPAAAPTGGTAAAAEPRARAGVCEPNTAVGAQTHALAETMLEVFERSGYRDVRADVAGRTAPDVVRGTIRSHRPSLTAVAGGCPVLLDVFIPQETEPEEQLSRWHLFASAAQQIGGEFHVVVPSRIDGQSGRSWAGRFAEATGLAIHKVWEV
jgi:hypothetical protein